MIKSILAINLFMADTDIPCSGLDCNVPATTCSQVSCMRQVHCINCWGRKASLRYSEGCSFTSPTSAIFHFVQDLEGVRIVEFFSIQPNLIAVAVFLKVSGVCCWTSFLPELHLDFKDWWQPKRKDLFNFVFMCGVSEHSSESGMFPKAFPIYVHFSKLAELENISQMMRISPLP